VHDSAEEVLEKADWEAVDVMICDLGLPGMGGVELIAVVKRQAPQVVCLAYTLNADKEVVFAALRAGAAGYLLKGCSLLDLEDSVRKVLAGECPISPAIARRLLDHFLGSPVVAEVEILSSRETEVIRLLSGGLIYKEVADRLSISPHTVHVHIKSIYKKLEASGKNAAINRARELGYLG
jgi:DNA-binding NarL/FixJ family response regulator